MISDFELYCWNGINRVSVGSLGQDRGCRRWFKGLKHVQNMSAPGAHAGVILCHLFCIAQPYKTHSISHCKGVCHDHVRQ